MVQNRLDTRAKQSSNSHLESLKQLSSEGSMMRANNFKRNISQYAPTVTADSTMLPSYKNYDEEYTVAIMNPKDRNILSQQNNSVFKDEERLQSELNPKNGILSDAGIKTQVEVPAVMDPHSIAEEKRKKIAGAKGSAKKRTVLLDSAIKCRLPSFIVINVLDKEIWEGVTNPKKTKDFAVSLLNLLLKDPGYGPTFKLILDECPTWEKHRQRCDNASDTN